MKKEFFAVLVFSFLILSTLKTQAEEPSVRGSVGLTAAVGQSQYDFMVPIWISGKTTISPFFRFVGAEDIGREFGLGLKRSSILK